MFDKNGDFGKVGLPRHHIEKNGIDLVVLIIWSILIGFPSVYYISLVLINGTWLLKFVLI